MTKFCSNCGTEMNDTSNFCPSCGASQQSNGSTTNVTIMCSNCGAMIPQGLLTCPRCGTPLNNNDYKFALVIGYILSFIIPLGGIITGIYLLTRNDNQEVHKHGMIMIGIAVVFMIIGFIIFASFMAYQSSYYYYY